MSIAALILAAGASSRLGQPKQLVLVNGEPLLRRTARTVLATPSIAECAIVLGAHASACAAAIADLPLRVVENRVWAEGMSTSLRAGIEALQHHDAILVVLCDQLHLSAEHLASLITAPHSAKAEAVASTYAGITGVPAIFTRAWYPALTALQGDQGARAILRKVPPHLLATVPFPGGEIDLDSPEALQRALAQVATRTT